jgi:photosystem II stability/assembly factor-like uncharacterized protein
MKIFSLTYLWCIPIISGLVFLSPLVFPETLSQPKQQTCKAVAANIVFKSADGGKSWQDVSEGLPASLEQEGLQGNSLVANDKGLFLRVGNSLYHSTTNARAPYWTASFSPGEYSSITEGKPGVSTNNYWAVNLKNSNGTSIWSPIFDSTSEPRMRSVFETAGAAIFVGTDKGLFKTTNSGKTWKHVYAGGWVGNMAESDGVLLCTSNRRIIRSADNGEHWELVTDEDGVTWDVKQVRAGFAAISSGSASDTRKLRTSNDGGRTWQHTDAGLHDKNVINTIWRTWDERPRVKAFQTSITRVGENFFSIHPDGIFRSTDKGKTWKLLLPSVEGKFFNLFVAGNIIYAIPGKGGC